MDAKPKDGRYVRLLHAAFLDPSALEEASLQELRKWVSRIVSDPVVYIFHLAAMDEHFPAEIRNGVEETLIERVVMTGVDELSGDDAVLLIRSPDALHQCVVAIHDRLPEVWLDAKVQVSDLTWGN